MSRWFFVSKVRFQGSSSLILFHERNSPSAATKPSKGMSLEFQAGEDFVWISLGRPGSHVMEITDRGVMCAQNGEQIINTWDNNIGWQISSKLCYLCTYGCCR